MTKLSEISEVLAALAAQLAKAQAEILARIDVLEQALANVALPETAEQALTDLKTKVQALDDIVPDVVEPPPAE